MTDQQTSDPRRLSLPPVDTSMRVYRQLTISEAKFFLPAVTVGGVSLLIGLLSRPLYGVLGMFLAIVLFAVGAIGYARDRWWTSAPDRLASSVRYIQRNRNLPWTPANGTPETVHGIERIGECGVVFRTSGSAVALVEISPTNVAMQTRDEDDSVARQLGQTLDEELHDLDIDIYSTTRPPNDSELCEPYRQDTDNIKRVDEYLNSVAEWTLTEDSPRWGPNEWKQYAVVRASEYETSQEEHWTTEYIPKISTERAGEYETVGQAVHDKADRVSNAFSTVDGLKTSRVDASEATEIITRYWRGPNHELEWDSIHEKQNGHGPVFPQAIAPDIFDQNGDSLQLEDQLVRTIWIAEWPTDPDPLFLRDLYTARGVDLDVCLSLKSQDKKRTKEYLDEQTAQVDAETIERQESGDITAIDTEDDIEYYLRMRRLLKETSAEAWRLSGYVTVRCSDSDALAYVEETVGEIDSLEFAKESALSDACSDATRLLEREPADCLPVQSRTKQVDAFKSGAPTHPDSFAEIAKPEVRTLVCGGLVGGAFPFIGQTPQDPDGLDFGRNLETMRTLRADPFSCGSAPHGLVVGKSRSGKTHGVCHAVLPWFAQSDDHNLILCDTQSGFHGITKFPEQEHIVVDGQQSINPLDIQPIPEYQRDCVGGQSDPYRRTVETATQFILGILRAQGVKNPGEFTATIEHGLEVTYSDADIYPGDLDSHSNPSPTIGDFLETLGEMLDNPGEYTFTDHSAEADAKVNRVANLLDKLSGFHDGGKYSHLRGETGEGLLAEGLDMAYLDCQQLQGAADAEKSVTLQLLLGQVSQYCKRVDGKTLFVIDEAHMLLHSEDMVSWLEKAARELARYDAGLVFVTQSLREFLDQIGDRDSGQENQRQTILDQCSFKQLYYMDLSDISDGQSDCLKQLGLNAVQDNFVRHEAARGKDNDYSESLVSLVDYRGWFPTRIESGPLEQHILEYQPSEHGNFEDYMDEYDA